MEWGEKRNSVVGQELQVRVRVFAGLRQVLGTGSLTLSLSPGATVSDLMERLNRDYPDATPQLQQLYRFDTAKFRC